jgi:hypothetical protein
MARLVPETFIARSFEDQFDLHVVATTSEPFVYIARTGRPRIALFGEVAIKPPVLAEARRVTATTRGGDSQIRLIVRRRSRDIHLDSDLTARDVIEMMAEAVNADPSRPEEITGLGLGYSDVVGLLYQLERKGALGGPIVLQPLEYRILGPEPGFRPIRPEGEEPDLTVPPEVEPEPEPGP